MVEGARESASYLQLTLRALATFGLTPREQEEGWTIASQGYASPGVVQVEGDWSNAAPWLCLGMLGGEGVTVTGFTIKDRRITTVQTSEGDVGCEVVVNAAGLWARQLGELAGINLPITVVEHEYFVTEKSPMVPDDLARSMLDEMRRSHIDNIAACGALLLEGLAD